MLAPMLAALADAPLVDPALVYEPKYDGIRAIADIGARGRDVRLWSRLGNDKTAQFPEIAAALTAWARRRTLAVVLDGELVALDANGQPAGFQKLQSRIHLKEEPAIAGPVAFMVFDLLRVGDHDLRDLPLTDRRAALEQLFASTRSPRLRLTEQVVGDGRALYDRALASGWEGLIAKRASSRYRSGKRTTDWCKLKIVHEQEFVIGGWTEPRQSRQHFGALLLGVYDGERLVYAGNLGTGFDERALADVMARLSRLKTSVCPFASAPAASEHVHWVRPTLVAQVKFTEWTTEGRLRHPVFMGLRDDKRARDVVREDRSPLHASTTVRLKQDATKASPDLAPAVVSGVGRTNPGSGKTVAIADRTARDLVEQLNAIEASRRDGVLALPGGDTLAVTNLQKVFWPALKLTKGDLFRYYARVAPFILPVLADRPLVMKRFPNGIDAKPFYQHHVHDLPPGIRAAKVEGSGHDVQLVGGDLKTLLYTSQLAAISQDPWSSRVQSPGIADHVVLDLDPAENVPFTTVLDVARWVRDELESHSVFALPKTSGASGIHIFIPLAPHTPYEAGLLFCQIVATMVADKHPAVATVERSVRARGRRVYVDYLQNIEGKTLASAYSARASDYAGVSTPLTWAEVDAGIRREDFTIATVPARLTTVGDLWKPLRTSKGVDLRQVVERSVTTARPARARRRR